MKKTEKKKRFVIFGAGMYGKMARKKYKDDVAFFIDNNKDAQKKAIDGLPVKSVEEFLQDTNGYKVIVASGAAAVMIKQLEKAGFTDYIVFTGEDTRYYKTDELIYNPYLEMDHRGVDEEEFNQAMSSNLMIQSVNEYVRGLGNEVPLFSLVEIETINQCNGSCAFCPVSKGNDTRKPVYMSDEVFKKIIDELSAIEYDGRLTIFGNNEPLLDPKIVERHQYARERVPKAIMHLYTNGTLMTIDLFKSLMECLDEMIIDNYHNELKLIKPCKEIVDYCEVFPEYKKKTTIVLRDPHEIMSSRGGDAPNRQRINNFDDDCCTQPFKQIEIRSEGKCSLCCADPLGKMTLGDVRNQSLLEIWYGEEYNGVRKAITRGRKNIPQCRSCDFFDL